MMPVRPSGRVGLVHVSRRRRGPAGIEARGLPVPTVETTLVDLAATLTISAMDQVWRQAEFMRLLDSRALAREVEMHRRKGNTETRRRLDAHRAVEVGPFGVRSPMELDAIKELAARGFPLPVANVPMWLLGRRYIPDLLFVKDWVIVELDSWSAHSTVGAMGRDRRIDIDLRSLGYEILRFTKHQIENEPGRCCSDIIAAILRQRARGIVGSAPGLTPGAMLPSSSLLG